MTKITFFKSKTLLVLIPVLILILLTLGYFFVSNNSQKAQKTSYQSSISTSSPANSISQNPSQGNFASSNSSNSVEEIKNQNRSNFISGNLTYISQEIPDILKICAENQENGVASCVENTQKIPNSKKYKESANSINYKIEIPKGKYKVYYVAENSIYGNFSELSECFWQNSDNQNAENICSSIDLELRKNQKSIIINVDENTDNSQIPLGIVGGFEKAKIGLNLKNPINYFHLSLMKTSSDKIKPLIADAEHDVAVIEECDLAIRFDKNKYGLKLKMSKNFNDKDVVGILLNDSKYIYENELIYTEFIYCEPYQKQSQDKSDISPYKSKLFKNLLDSVDSFRMSRAIRDSSLDCVGVNYTIIHKTNFYYLRDDISPVSLDCALFPDGKFSDMFRQYNPDLLQIQFNSLAPSTPSVKI